MPHGLPQRAVFLTQAGVVGSDNEEQLATDEGRIAKSERQIQLLNGYHAAGSWVCIDDVF